MSEERKAEIRRQIDALVAEYAALAIEDETALTHAWVLCFGATRIEWNDGREQTGMIHPNVPFSTRLGLITSAQADLLKQ